MGLMDKFKSIFPGNDYDEYDYEDDYERDEEYGESDYNDVYSDSEAEERQERRSARSERQSRSERGYRPSRTSSESRIPKIINFQATTQIQVVIQKPVSFDEARTICDHIVAKRTLVLNLEGTDEKEAHRLFDFLSGAAYAHSCGFKKIASRTFLITPANVDVMGDALLDELESNGYYNNY